MGKSINFKEDDNIFGANGNFELINAKNKLKLQGFVFTFKGNNDIIILH